MKKFLVLFLIFSILLGNIGVICTFADSTDEIILGKINELYSLVGNTHFTVDREAAGSKEPDCLLSNIISATWFKEKFNIYDLSTNKFPTSARYPNSQNAYSCTGFSLFAEWYIFKNSNSDYVKTNKLDKMAFNYSNVASNAKVGDLISLSGGLYKTDGTIRDDNKDGKQDQASHELIFLSANSSGITVLDSNWGNNCKVTKHTIGYYYCDDFQIARATTRGEITPNVPTPEEPETDEIPGKPILYSNKSEYQLGKDVTLTWDNTEYANNYWLDMYKDGVHIDGRIVKSPLVLTDLEPGKYKAYITANNVYGHTASNGYSFEVIDNVKPYTSSMVIKNENILTIHTELYNITEPYDLLIVGYKGSQFITIKRVPHNEQNSPYTLEGDIDEIKVMAWDNTQSYAPLCNSEVIPDSEFITE